jgi:hypothetical protein
MGSEEMLNLQDKRSREFTPAAVAPPKYDKRRTVGHYRSAQGRKGGTGTSPTVDNYSVLIEKTRFPYENRSLQIECRDCFPSQTVTMIAPPPMGRPCGGLVTNN